MAILSPQEWGGECVKFGDVATIKGGECLVVNLLRVLMPVAGLAFAAMVVLAGFKFITAGGESKGIGEAKQTLTMAFLGLLVVIGAWFILRFIEEFTGLPVTRFEIPSQ